MPVDRSKSINSRRRGINRDFDRNKNLQLESLYLRELGTRVEAWKRHEDEIARQRQNWPSPVDGKAYNAREKSIYGANSNDFNHDLWFPRRMYEDDLFKASQRHHVVCDSLFNACPPSKETQLEKEVMQLRTQLSKLKSCPIERDGRPWCEQHLQPMYPVKPAIRYILYNGTSKELEGRIAYLKRRKIDAPDEKYCEPLCTSWDITWDLKSTYGLRPTRLVATPSMHSKCVNIEAKKQFWSQPDTVSNEEIF